MAHQITRSIQIPVSDGTQMPAFLAVPEHKGEVPGVVIFQEIFGVDTHIKEMAKQVAQLGFVAVAPELFHRTAPGFHGSYDDYGPGMKHAQAMKRETLEADIRAAHQYLSSDPHVKSDNIAVMGFCLGGRVSFLANALLPLRAAISFYGGGIAPGLLEHARDQHGPILLFWGGKDKHIPPAQTRTVEDTLTAQGKPFVNVVFSQADHGFMCEQKTSYHAAAASQAWALVTAFLKDFLV